MTAAHMVSPAQILGKPNSILLPETDAWASLPINIQTPGEVWNERVGGWSISQAYSDDRGGGSNTWTQTANHMMKYSLGYLKAGTYKGSYLFRQDTNGGRIQFEIWQYPIGGGVAGQRFSSVQDCYAAAWTRAKYVSNVVISVDSRVEFRVTCVGTKQAASSGFWVYFVGMRLDPE